MARQDFGGVQSRGDAREIPYVDRVTAFFIPYAWTALFCVHRDTMNTVRSTWIGWGALIVAGGGAYVFAKRSVNADKKARHEEEMKRRRLKDALDAEFYAKPPSPKQGHKKPHDHANSPSTEASHDPAPTEHPLENGDHKAQEEGKYVAAKPYKSRKGDRFS